MLFSENIFPTLVSSLLLSMSSDDNEISELSDKFDCVGAMVMLEGWLEVSLPPPSYKYHPRLQDHSSLSRSSNLGQTTSQTARSTKSGLSD